MGTTLPQGLVTASKAPTPGGTDKAIKTFLHSPLTCECINDLVDAGNNVFTLYILTIVQPKVTSHPDGAAVMEGKTREGFLGQASNAMIRVSFDLISTNFC